MLALIVAVDREYLIGNANQLPWQRIPADMKFFRTKTLGHTVIMGRKTFDSIGKPLPGRENIVITRDMDLKIPGVRVLHSVAEVLASIPPDTTSFVIGGAQIYKDFLPYVDTLYLTSIDGEFAGDTYFPSETLDAFKLVSEESVPVSESTPYPLTFKVFTASRIFQR